MSDLAAHASELGRPPAMMIPSPEQLRLEQVHLPRDAFFGRAEQIRRPARPAVSWRRC
jgi:arginine decarboxylase